MKTNTPAGNKEAREWNKQVVALIDKFEKYRVSDSSDFGKELQMEFEYIDTEFPTPDEALLKEVKEVVGTESGNPPPKTSDSVG